MILSYRVSDKVLSPILDTVNAQDEPIGTIDRKTLKEEQLQRRKMYVRTVNCFILNHKNEIWTPTRSNNHKFFPNSVDFSCGGYVHTGETYKEALIGGLKKEAGLDINQDELTFLGKLNPLVDQIKSFMEVYKLIIDQEINYNNNDYSHGEWIEKEKLIEKLQSKIPAKADLLPVLLKFQGAL